MNDSFSNIARSVSIFDRLMKMYYDRELADFEIGWGQQFYVEYIFDHPGASPQEMAQWIRVDKATLTKMIKKLTQVGYIRVELDQKDHRVKHLYLMEKAVPAALQIKKIHQNFNQIFSSGFSAEEINRIEKDLCRMTDNINQKVWHRMEEHNGK